MRMHSGHAIHAVRLAWALVAPGLLWAAPARGQSVPEEGFPQKTIVAPGVREEGELEACGPFEVPGDLGAGCVEDRGPSSRPFVSEGAGFSVDSPGPARYAPPRLDCPSAVFLEELETGAIIVMRGTLPGKSI